MCATERTEAVLETRPSKWKVLRPGPGDRARNVKAFSRGPTCTAAEAPEAKMWVIKICDERNEILLGFSLAIPLSEDVRKARSSECLRLVPDQNISPSAEIYFLSPPPTPTTHPPTPTPGPPFPPIAHPLFL